jgi:hypothetical protein
MSISWDVEELKKVNTEIKRLNLQTKTLRKTSKEIELRILDFLYEKKQSGLKHQGTAITVENKQKRPCKRGKDKENDAIGVLESHGISNAQKVLLEILDARRGDEIEHKSLRIKKLTGL